MAYWLFKTEPETWSWTQQKKMGAKGEPWSGVRNYQAAGNMKKMMKGDRGFFYHSGTERSHRRYCRSDLLTYREDPTDLTGRFGLVVVKAAGDMPRPVSLAEIKLNTAAQGYGAGKKLAACRFNP